MIPFLVVHPEVLMLVTVTPNSGFKILTSDKIKELVSKYRSFQTRSQLCQRHCLLNFCTSPVITWIP